MSDSRLILAVLACIVSGTGASADETPSVASLAGQDLVVGEIVLDKANVFDLENPEENNWLYRLANRLHIVTRDKVIRKQLLIRPGDDYSQQVVDESERLLRQNGYLWDASIRPLRVENGVVDLAVKTRDVWTLGPDFSASRKGGENKTRIGIEESNFFGLGQTLRFSYEDNVDRRSKSFEFFDRHLGRSWVSARLHIADNSDGERHRLSMIRPFYSLRTRWSAGFSIADDEERNAFYDLGDEAAEFRRRRDYLSVFGGWSSGLRNGWVTRWTAGVVYDHNRFDPVANPTLPQLVPQDRKLVYPFIAIQLLENRFETAANRDHIGKTEDFHLGLEVALSVGYSARGFDAARDAILWSGSIRRGFGDINKSAVLVSAGLSGRRELGRSVNSLASLRMRYYRVQSEKRLFFATLTGTRGNALDLDNLVELGGDTGLRGYPQRYQTGESSILVTLEQRFFTDWYPFRLVRVGGAVFADAGRVWGNNPLDERRFNWLTNVGFGLRLARTRTASDKLIHLDIAFPLGGDASIDGVQVLLESKRSF